MSGMLPLLRWAAVLCAGHKLLAACINIRAATHLPESPHPTSLPLSTAVISVAEARVTHLLRGHTREVVELAAAGAGAPRLLASLARDGCLRLWDVPSEACLSSLQHADASCIVSRCTAVGA